MSPFVDRRRTEKLLCFSALECQKVIYTGNFSGSDSSKLPSPSSTTTGYLCLKPQLGCSVSVMRLNTSTEELYCPRPPRRTSEPHRACRAVNRRTAQVKHYCCLASSKRLDDTQRTLSHGKRTQNGRVFFHEKSHEQQVFIYLGPCRPVSEPVSHRTNT